MLGGERVTLLYRVAKVVWEALIRSHVLGGERVTLLYRVAKVGGIN